MRTGLCDLLDIDAPIIQASVGPWSSPELTAAACEAGALGSLGAALRTAPELAAQIERLSELTERPFAINHTTRPFDEEAFRVTLEARPKVIPFAIGRSAELVERAHAAGAATTRAHARCVPPSSTNGTHAPRQRASKAIGSEPS